MNDRRPLPDADRLGASLAGAPAVPPPDLPQPADRARGRSGFALGFSFSLTLLLLAAALYVLAPTLTAAVPALSPTLSAYLVAVDGLRLWLDGMAEDLRSAMRGLMPV